MTPPFPCHISGRADLTMGDSMQGSLNLRGFVPSRFVPADWLWNMGPFPDKDSSPGRGRVVILPR
jgi:hypothetical protein